MRGAGNAMAKMDREELELGVVTASAGNMAQGVAWNARRLGVRCTVVAPDHAPDAKVHAVERLGGRVLKVPFDEWWQAFVDGIGSKTVFASMLRRARRLLDGAVVVTLDEVAAAVRLLAGRAHVVAEGAGAAPVAAALSGRAGGGRVACVVSGGSIDPATLASLLAGRPG